MPEIQVTDEKGNVHVFPDGSTPEMISKALNVQVGQSSASLDLSNKQGQGTYSMKDKDGQSVPVPYGLVSHAAQLGYGFADDASRQRFNKDVSADPSHPQSMMVSGMTPQESTARAQHIEKNSSFPMQVVGGAAKGAGTLLRPVLDAAALQSGMSPQQVDQMLASQTGVQQAAKYATVGAGAAAAVPAALAAPVATAGTLAGGALGAYAGGKIGQAAGMSPQATQVLGDVGGAVGGLGGGLAGSQGDRTVSNGVQTAKSYFRPPTSPAIVPQTEMAARQLSAAVLPAGKDASNFIQAAQQEVPNVIDYAKRTNNPLNTQLEFSKAAQGYAQEVRDIYEKNVLGPVENKMVKTTGTGYGRQTGEGPDTFASLGDIDKRVTEINKQLDAPAMNADDSRRALASKTELQNEAAGLRDILHRNLSQSSGIAPEQIADLRQRVGRSYELANDTNAAVTGRMQSVGKSELGPVQITQLPSRAIEFARGGPVPIADRAFQRAIRNFPGQSTPPPSPQPVITGMTPPPRASMASALGIQAEPNPLQAVPMDASAQVSALNDSLAARRVAGQGRAAQLRAEALARFQRQQELMARARQLQENARNQ